MPNYIDMFQCNLCQITFGAFNMKDEWKEFIKKLPYEIEFLHKDEFAKKYGNKNNKFPNAYVQKENNLSLLISSKEMNSVKNIEDLKSLVQQKIKTLEK